MSTISLGEQMVAEARQWRGTPFYHTGREKGIGVDCAGLVLGVWHALSLTGWDDRHYAPGGDAERLYAGLERFCDRIDQREGRAVSEASRAPLLQPGDILLIAFRRLPIHVGLVTGAGTFIHALETVGRVVEVPLDERWRSLIVGVWRWREEE